MSLIDDRYAELGGSNGFLGAPVGDEDYTDDSHDVRFRVFEYGAIYWVLRTAPTQVHEIHGAIWQLYQTLGMHNSFLELPVTDETGCPDGVGRFNQFVGGSIYWTPQTGAHEVHGAIWQKWSSLGWERGPLGYPISNELPTADGKNRFNNFQNGAIYWANGQAHEIHGAIWELWKSMNFEFSPLGFPASDENPTPDGQARFNHFQGGGIYWHGGVACEVHGDIWKLWASMGWERGWLGYPVTHEYRQRKTDRKRRISAFEHGHISWTTDDGARAHHEPAPPLPQIHVVPIFWGSTWDVNTGIAGNTSIDCYAAIQKIIDGIYLSGLWQYGVGNGLIDPPVIAPGDPPAKHKNSDIEALVQQLIHDSRVRVPTDFPADEIPLYTVMLKEGLMFVDDKGNRLDDIGYHWTVDWNREVGIAWVSQGKTLEVTTPFFSHELAESFTDEEIADRDTTEPPGSFVAQLDGVTVQAYYSHFNQAWLVPSLPLSRQ
jgi:uncharacterized protein with LGFP repeats